jgi:diacylglycerol kinase (ATP)
MNTIDFKRIFKAGQNSIAGLKDGVVRHTAFRQELIIAIVMTPLAFWLGENGLETALLVIVLLLVLIVELINSAIETVVNRISVERNKLSKQAKDLGSAAVLISLINVPLVWGLILFD